LKTEVKAEPYSSFDALVPASEMRDRTPLIGVYCLPIFSELTRYNTPFGIKYYRDSYLLTPEEFIEVPELFKSFKDLYTVCGVETMYYMLDSYDAMYNDKYHGFFLIEEYRLTKDSFTTAIASVKMEY
jgi:hypothetical protein